jgi:hypothetical protein
MEHMPAVCTNNEHKVCEYFFYSVFRATKGKTEQGVLIQCMIFIGNQTCNMILHVYRYHQIYIITLREDI